MSKDTGGPAFARAAAWNRPGATAVSTSQEGMSLRDYTAIKCCAAMVGTIRSDFDYNRLRDIAMAHDLDSVSEFFAQEAYKQADAMMTARLK